MSGSQGVCGAVTTDMVWCGAVTTDMVLCGVVRLRSSGSSVV
ncbi:MAG: hypothetical protein ABW185_23035 [Sedimenticola sp.]